MPGQSDTISKENSPLEKRCSHLFLLFLHFLSSSSVLYDLPSYFLQRWIILLMSEVRVWRGGAEQQERNSQYLMTQDEELQWFLYIFLFEDMSRRLEAADVAAIEKVRAALREESSHSSNTQEDHSSLDDPALDPFHSDLLLKDKVTNLSIVGHELVAPSEEGRQFASYEMEVTTVDLSYRLSRRFSQFHQLYREVRKIVSLKCDFPRKVYNPFVSSTSPAVVEERSSKLHFFLKEVLNHVRACRDPAVTLLFFSFLGLKQHYEQKQLAPSYKKCNSEKLAYYRMLSLKPALSEGLRAADDQNSLDFQLFLLASNASSEQCLRDIDQLLKARRAKLSLEEIKTLFVGSRECPGLLRYGLSNGSQANRVGALEILLGSLLPEQNPHSERFERVLDKLPVEEWRVAEVSMLESAPFKVLYFRLLRLYCEHMERDHSRTEALLLRDLFLFHRDLFDDYFAWKRVHEREHALKQHLDSAVDHARKIELTEFEEDKPELIRLLSSQSPTLRAYVSQSNCLLVFYFESTRELGEEELVGWNRCVSDVTVDEYTSVVRATLAVGHKRIALRVRSLKHGEAAPVLQAQKRLVGQVRELEEARDVVGESSLLLFKEEYPAEFESEFSELVWLNRQQGRSRVLTAVHFAAGLKGTGTSAEQLARDLFQDIASRFPI